MSRPVRKRQSPWDRRLSLEQLEDRIVPSFTLVSHYTGLDSAGVGGGGEPPDNQGAAGPSSVVESVNQGIAIYSPKATASSKVTDTLADFYFTKGGLPHIPVGTGNVEGQTDPFVIYDPLVQRFIVGNLDFEQTSSGGLVNNAGNALLLAVSKDSNPTTLTNSSWYFYEIKTSESGVALQDYSGHPGYTADALVVTLNPYDSGGMPLSHSLVNAISINSLISGGPLTLNSNYFQTDIPEFLMRPASMQDSTPGGPEWMVAAAGGGAFTGAANTIDLLKMTNVLSASPAFTSYTLTVNPYYQAVVPIDSSGNAIDSGTDSRMLQTDERGGLLVAADEVADAAGDANLARWYEVNVSSGAPVLVQQGDVGGGPNTFYDYPGIGINAQGDIGMAIVTSGKAPGMFESMYVTGRTPSDPAGTMEAPVLVQGSTNAYVGTRQGDMSAISVDPNGSFWGFSQWANNQASPNWGTAIANFSFASPINITLSSATEGIPLNGVQVATFFDSSGLPPSRYSASISWGDGTTSNGTIIASGSLGTYRILGSHTYFEEGNYVLTVTVRNGSNTIGPVSGIVTVGDAPLDGFAQALHGETAQFVTNSLVAVFTDTDVTNESPSNYNATIIWNEGNGLTFTSTGTINRLAGNTFAVFGSSPYTFPSGGLFAVDVVVRDVGGASVTVPSVISVANNPAIPPLFPQYTSDLGPVSAQYLALQDALTNLLGAERLFLFALAQGTLQEKEGSFGNLLNAFRAYESAIFAYDIRLPGS